MNALCTEGQLFRIWIAEYEGWQPAHWHEMPPAARAIEPACDECLTAEQAAQFLQGFNEAMLVDPRQLWAVAVPVERRWAGDLAAGAVVRAVTHPELPRIEPPASAEIETV